MLFLVVGFGGVQRHAGHGADGAPHAVVAAGKHGVVKVAAPAGQRLEGLALDGHAVAVGQLNGLHIFGPFFADTRQLAAGDNAALGVHDADDPIRGFLELQHYILKDPSRHDSPPEHPWLGWFLCNLFRPFLYYTVIITILQEFFYVFNKNCCLFFGNLPPQDPLHGANRRFPLR